MVIDFSSLPSVDAIMQEAVARDAQKKFGRCATLDAIRATLADERLFLKNGRNAHTIEQLAAMAFERLEADSLSSLRAVFNLTGTILHTNLGRAQLPEAAIEAAICAMRETVSLEFDLETGKRGERDDHLRSLICELTGAEDATLVNNNAAALFLVLNTLSQKKSNAIISRGELIEIGGSFRMPDIMESAGCHLTEVGTTNRTHCHDYEQAIDEETALLLKVHTSNYSIEGFTQSVSTAQLSSLAKKHCVPMIEDLGSGTLVDLHHYGLKREPTVQETIKSGADIVTFSGDKLLGGPQIGFIIGNADMIAAINRNPLKRSLRVDKIRLAALEAVLRLYRNHDTRHKTIPTLRFLSRSKNEIASQAHKLCRAVSAYFTPDYQIDVVPCLSQIGSGALPTQTLESFGLSIRAAHSGSSLNILAKRLRNLPIPVIGRFHDDALLLDLRCLRDHDQFIANLD
ncbi:L-seryl-tRNA(Sec) selenium transferase [Bartonella tamiae]|uniref:L-seryl-tRNA(Sec) selenium transferase n=1 Tax=Bartonella tamiae Th239 TaxID=1094558 RepID=J1K3K6_9HYPH|nr:L-seryl-tRNA(Sec) selenium transferase [Bartonella tamiae]EJF91720.1 L-seryl-tRNA selenium transferase [Bartonella tamiae Th239]EJF92612.1 L-seryl-tRNA selenium transferase [Bartonella tamiae Th307]